MPCTYQHSYKCFFFLKYKVILQLNDETRLLEFKIQQFECLLPTFLELVMKIFINV